ncbi:MAG: T9SS type A sorting domain-containing protein [Bacteroidetes bacterium]|nr:T9SS type A sorting domain-containing protein [Bacteroidota bacterium]
MRILTVLLLLLYGFVSSAQNYVWAKGEGGIGNDAANGIALDADGNTYITGNFAGSANFSGQSIQGGNLYDVFIAKYGPSGNLLWVKSNGGVNNEQGNAIRVKGGFIYICGFMEDSCYFGNQLFLTSGEADVFTAKYDLDGNLIWVRKAGGTGFDYASSLDVDDQGHIYIAGTYENAITFDTAQLSTTNLFAESFYAKYDGNGQLLWAKSTKGNSTNQLTGIAVAGDALYTTGFFGGNFKIGNTSLNSSTPSYDIVLARLDLNGNLQWMKKAGSTLEDAANALCIDQAGQAIIGGYFAGTASFDNHTVTYYDYNDAFVAKYDSSGNNLWVRAGKGPELDAVFGITTDAENNIYATGLFEASLDVEGTLLTGPDREVFIISYNPQGSLRWATKGGGIQTECGLGIAIKDNSNVMACGYYLHTCSFGTISLDYADANDLFLLEYDQPFVSGIENNPTALRQKLYPTIIQNLDELILPDWAQANATLQVFNGLGQLLYQTTLTSNRILSHPALPSGMYIIAIRNEANSINQKIFLRP